MRGDLAISAFLAASPAAAQGPAPAVVDALDRCLAAIASRSVDPFRGWSSYAPRRYFSEDGSVIIGLGTRQLGGRPVGYCLVSPGQGPSEAWTDDVASVFEVVEDRIASGRFRAAEPLAEALPTELVERMEGVFDEAVFALDCAPEDHPGIFVQARWGDGFVAIALPDGALLCNGREN